MNAKTKPLPSLRSDAQAEAFVASADLTEYDLSGFRPMRFRDCKKRSRAEHAPACRLAGCRPCQGQGGRDSVCNGMCAWCWKPTSPKRPNRPNRATETF